MEDKFKLSLTAAEIDDRLSAIGDVESLKTTDKSSIVAAINEIADSPYFGTSSVPGGSGDTFFPVEIEPDKTLSIEGQAADAKAVGDRLGAIEYQTVTTDIASSHKGLIESEKTVVFEADGSFGNKAYINYGIDLMPRGGFNRTFPWEGITIVQKGDTFDITGQISTSSCTINFTQNGTNRYVELPEGLIGKTVHLLGFIDKLSNDAVINLYFYDANKQQLLKQAHYLAKTSTSLNKSLVVPEGTVYYEIQFYHGAKEATFDHKLKLYLLVENEFEEVSLSDSVIKDNITPTAFSTLPYKSYVQYKVPLNDYISNFAGGGMTTYLTPEDFGAKGDGVEDDSEAIALCLEEASVSKQTVLMAKKYCISTPLEIKQDGLNILVNDIVYDGTDTAIKISGQNNTVKIHSIISGGVGISYRADNDKMVKHNDVDVNVIDSTLHGIVFYRGLMGIYQNTIKFNSIKAGGSGTYGICTLDAEGDSWVTENNFYGGQISNCEWAIYKITGLSKLYGIQIEESVQGGFYIDGNITIFHPRISEAQRDGNLPTYKFIQTKNTVIYSDAVSISEIDLSECSETVTNVSGNTHSLTEGALGVINGRIYTRYYTVGKDVETGVYYSDKTYVWGKYLILSPHMNYRKVVTLETLDTRLIGRTDETWDEVKALSQLPTKFVVDNTNAEIYLHASYCAFGYNEFEVEQANGFTCRVYDVNENLIFDGRTQGDGTYKFNIYKEAELAKNNYAVMMLNNMCQYWNVEKVINDADLTDTEARERLDNIEYKIITTESAYEHSELPEVEKDLIIEAESLWGEDVYINYGMDLLPRGGFNKTFPEAGMTITKNDDIFEFNGQLTANFGAMFLNEGSNDYRIALPEGLAGKRIYLLRFADSLVEDIAITVTFYDADKNKITDFAKNISKFALNQSDITTIPENTAYYSVQLWQAKIDKKYDFKVKIYILVEDGFEKITLSNGKATRKGVTATSLSTLPYLSYLRYKNGVKELATKADLPEINVDEIIEKVQASINVYKPISAESWTDNWYGNTTNNAYCSVRIPVTPGQRYTIPSASPEYSAIDFLGGVTLTDDTELVIIDSEYDTIWTEDYSTYVDVVRFTVPENVNYIVIASFKTGFENLNFEETVEKFNSFFMLIEGDEYPLEYVPYVKGGYRIKDNVELPKGTGTGGIHIGSGEMPDDSNIQIDPDGDAFEIDETLTQEGQPADAKATGDRLSLLENYVTPQMFGAAADGVTDDTDAVRKALNSGEIVVLLGEYAINKPIAGSATCVYGINAKIEVLADIDTIFTLNSATHISGIEFNCNNHTVGRCIVSSKVKNVKISNISIHDVYNSTNDISTTLINITNSEILKLDNIHFDNCSQKGDGNIANGEGNITCIYVAGYTKHCSIENITVNEIHNFQVVNDEELPLYEDSNGIYVRSGATSAETYIKNVYGYNYGKRLIKSQCAGHIVIDGVTAYNNSIECLSAIGVMEYSSTEIGTASISNCTLTNECTDLTNAQYLIASNIETTIMNCILKSGDKHLAVYNAYKMTIYNCDVTGNGVHINGSYYTHIYNCQFNIASENIFLREYSAGNDAIIKVTDCTITCGRSIIMHAQLFIDNCWIDWTHIEAYNFVKLTNSTILGSAQVVYVGGTAELVAENLTLIAKEVSTLEYAFDIDSSATARITNINATNFIYDVRIKSGSVILRGVNMEKVHCAGATYFENYPEYVTNLPTPSFMTEGAKVILTSNNKLYKFTNGAWILAEGSSDLSVEQKASGNYSLVLGG